MKTLLKSYKFEFCECWIQLHDIPWDRLKEEVIMCIVKDLGSVALINWCAIEKWTNFSRVKVNINISNPLNTRLSLLLPDDAHHHARVLYEELS